MCPSARMDTLTDKFDIFLLDSPESPPCSRNFQYKIPTLAQNTFLDPMFANARIETIKILTVLVRVNEFENFWRNQPSHWLRTTLSLADLTS